MSTTRKTSAKASRTRHKRAGATQLRGGIATVRHAYERYWDDHGRFTVDPVRIQVAWNKVRKDFAAELIGPSLYRKSASFYQKEISKGVSPATVRRDMTAALVAPIRHCFKLGLIHSLPAFYTVKQKPNIRLRVLDDKEIEQIIDASREWPWLFKTTMILAHTAQRIKAVLELEWWQVDLNARLINFNRPKDRNWERKKGRGIVPISDELFGLMDAWARDHNLWTKPLHPRVVGEIPGAFYFFWRRMVKRSGVRDPGEVTPHVMRHSIATKLVREGKDIRLVQLMLGHKTITTTEQTYVKNNPETLRGAVQSMSFINSKGSS